MDAVRKLYNGTPKNNHRQLGYIFRMLPFISVEHNILCHRPFAKNIEDVEPMSLREFCEAVGLRYSRTAISRLQAAYSNIQFMVHGFPELFCAFVTDGHNHEADKIFVNPRILYSGRNPEQVWNLIQLMPKPHNHVDVTTLRNHQQTAKARNNADKRPFTP